MTKIAINGLGRIGRAVVRALVEESSLSPRERAGGEGLSASSNQIKTPHPNPLPKGEGITLVAANGPAANDTHVYLLKHDSVHGMFRGDVSTKGESITAGNLEFLVTHERDPAKLRWGELGVDVVLECSGRFNSREASMAHIAAGAKKVLVSAPCKEADATIVYGVNNDALAADHQVVSVGSCTTNCLAPIAKVLNDGLGIESGFMTTIHAYTGDQNIVDGSHKDMRRARAAAMSMIPTSTGAAKALSLVLPELEGKLNGTAIRVPTPNVSMVDLTFTAGRDTSAEEVNAMLTQAAAGPLKGVLDVCSEPLVSIDFNHHPASSIADLTGTVVTNKRLVRVASWYDNEWGFSNRMLDVARLLQS